MEKIEINPKTQFFGWFCGDIEKNLGNVFLKLIFMSILNNESIVVLEAIDKNIYDKISQYKSETGDIDFSPSDYMELCDEVLVSLKTYFLSENRV
ncbi:hypothetical protein A2467_00100 [Candidatus Nomurabacteria bacterium RIFOXYC2_FULL_36_8]|nr:MAG: hypothetical protein UR97_C0005G0003 [Candidatus Nomurabacteria bacterium GW2011_GWE2_36_115]KKP93718.1 MAG: hypothetical protein US00_C0005G0003 [Candidatus Nomurabacteria bacterium GW2011_GWF2_36_126]KKP97215.1 MAG: hypothetical protein US04_C0001G0718 [Candidatus Nomurabacteria bacterium GW2011_GWD2_36_14]KKP99180.1 MAG: hypothetical protein US08_C0002G0003 [Candidatus Nomurabacteria bacterium GW2011_GWF2_36_19]KKQ05827.1 MAG: hypothetical protein US17_C0001G0005 [Candidatus Nomuraba